MPGPERPPHLWLEGVGVFLESAVRIGLVSSAGIALLFGQIALAGVLAALALGLFLRLWRGRVRERK
jgi:hypothetical protein